MPPVFEFLGEPWEAKVLNFSKQPHDFGLHDSKISETKRFAPKIGIYHSWSQEEIASANEVAANTMRRLGYEI